jgi:hypothetical protein
VLREALSDLLRDESEDGYLIVQLVVEGMVPVEAARERGVSRPALVELLREAVDALAITYEDALRASIRPNDLQPAYPTRLSRPCRGGACGRLDHLPAGQRASVLARAHR